MELMSDDCEQEIIEEPTVTIGRKHRATWKNPDVFKDIPSPFCVEKTPIEDKFKVWIDADDY